MKRIVVFLKTTLYALPLLLSSAHVRKLPFAIKYESARLWTMIFLKACRVKIKIHHKNHLPLKEGVFFVVLNSSSVDQEVCISVFNSPFVSVLSKPKRLFMISKTWQKRIETVVVPTILSEKYFDASQNVMCFVDRYDLISDNLLKLVVKHKYPIILIDIDNAHRIIDENPHWRTIVDVSINIPIVAEEYTDLSLTQLKHTLIQRKEGTIYEHD
jgi:1-acyl-sn-glycerol-3-phosphate acyltransferase